MDAAGTPAPMPAPAPTPAPAAVSPAREFWRRFRRNRVAVAALAVLAVIIAVAVLAPLVAPQDPYDLKSLVLRDARKPPGYVSASGVRHLLGTDSQGRDLVSAIIYGLRISLQIGLIAGAIAFSIGALVGSVAAYVGGRVESLLMRIVDVQLSFPAILLAFVVAALLGQGKAQLILALVFSQYAYFVRTAHGAAKAERQKDYVQAALSVPMSGWFVITRHILPNALPPLIVVATVQVASAISLEATLSFLGVGLPPTEPSLGMLIANGFQYLMSGRYWIAVYPGIALIVLILSINLVGDQIRDQLNPRLRK